MTSLGERISSAVSVDDGGTKAVNVGWLVLLAGAAIAGSTTAGFALYGLLLVIIGLLACLVCPCLGAGVLAGTGVAWSICILIDVIAGLTALSVVGICGAVGLLQVGRTPEAGRTYVTVSGVVQVALGALGAWLLGPLLVTLMK